MFYCYAICYLRTKKLNKCDDVELSSDLPEKLFQKFSVLRNELKLDFDHQALESQCYIINDLLMSENYLFRFYKLCKKCRYLFHTTLQKK